jgi:hypothetical protein
MRLSASQDATGAGGQWSRSLAHVEAKMNIHAVSGALVVGALLAISPPANRSLAQTEHIDTAATQNVAANNTVATPKHRHWRFRGGRHPHFGSRRIRT